MGRRVRPCAPHRRRTLAGVPLPEDANAPWPPAHWKPVHEQVETNAAWYEGDESKLAAIYSAATTRRPSEGGGVLATAARWFWGRGSTDQAAARQRLHAPAAADVAATAADLLFGESPTLRIDEAHEEKAATDAKEAEDRLQWIGERDSIGSTLLEATEIAGALGGAFLRPVWDPDIAPHPMLTVVHADHAVPRWSFGRLRDVTFWRVLQTDGAGAVWRHLEHYEPGRILHGLYVGRRNELGRRVPLTAHPDTAMLQDEVLVPEGIVGPAARYVPNVRPHRKFRHLPVGRAHTEGTESFQDALDETWTAWMREIRLVKPRIVAAQDYLVRRGRGQGATFDLDQEVFVPLEIDPTAEGAKTIHPVEFQLHTEQYARTCAELFEKIVVTAGFSPSTFGLIGDLAVSQTATEVAAREGRTDSTVGRMARYWRAGVEDVAEMLLIIDREVFRSGVTPFRPTLVMAPRETDERKVAETVQLLRSAQAISIETAVQMAQPDLKGEALQAEVQRIMAEQAIVLPDPTGGLP